MDTSLRALRLAALDLLLRLRRVLVAGGTKNLFCAISLALFNTRYPRCSRRQHAGDHNSRFHTFDSPFQLKALTIVSPVTIHQLASNKNSPNYRDPEELAPHGAKGQWSKYAHKSLSQIFRTAC